MEIFVTYEYSRVEILGEGREGVVYKGIDREVLDRSLIEAY